MTLRFPGIALDFPQDKNIYRILATLGAVNVAALIYFNTNICSQADRWFVGSFVSEPWASCYYKIISYKRVASVSRLQFAK